MAILALAGGGREVRRAGRRLHDEQLRVVGHHQHVDRRRRTGTRVINMNQLGGHCSSSAIPPINMLFVYNSNPAVTTPDQDRVLRGLERDDLFTVVFEQVMTDTARYADVLLPNTTFLEGYDLVKRIRAMDAAAGHSRSSSPSANRVPTPTSSESCSTCTGLREEDGPARRARRDARRARPPAGTTRQMTCATRARRRRRSTDARSSSTTYFHGRRSEDPSVSRGARQEAAAGLYGYQPDPANRATSRSPSSRRQATGPSVRRWRKFHVPRCAC